MYFNHQDKDINIIKGGKKKKHGIKPYSWPGLPHYRVPLQPIAMKLQATMEQQWARGLRWNWMGGLGTGASPTRRRPNAAMLLAYMDASAMPSTATRWQLAMPAASERKPKHWGFASVCALREIRNRKAGRRHARWSFQLLAIWASFSTKWATNSWNWSHIY